jgi:predicted nucleotide-binding protein
MAKTKKTEQDQPIASTLIKGREEVKALLEGQIKAAETILAMQVAKVPKTHYNIYAGTRSQRDEYDETQQDEFLRQYKSWAIMCREIFIRSFEHQNNTDLVGFDRSGLSYVISDLVEEYKSALRDQIAYIKGFIERMSLIPCKVEQQTVPTEVTINGNKVFIVHGHDSNIRNEAELLVKQLGFEPVVLFKQPNRGDTIIEKLLRESSEVAFAIVLYTKCDEGKAVEETDLKPRPRQNVVFEHGLMCGILGRKNVVALVEEGVEVPGDLSGVVYIILDAAKRWQFDVAREMKASGLQVDLNKLM